jgi:hypothetical protein
MKQAGLCKRYLQVLMALAGMVASRAGAQALPTASGPGTFVAVGGGASAFQADYGQRILGGAVLWADVNPTWRYGLEGEARYLHYHTDEDVTEKSYLGGIRVTIRDERFRPYVKFLAGAGGISLPFHYATGTFLTYAPGAGADFIVSDRIIWRIADFEYQAWPTFPYGELKPYGVSMGLIIRINGVDRLPRRSTLRH